MTETIETYRHRSPADMIEGQVAGLLLPFDVSDERPGLHFDDESGELTFFAYTTYSQSAFRGQLAREDPLNRVHFMWVHGLEGGVASIPIGSVTELRSTPEAMMFRASLNETQVADQMRAVLAAGEVKEISAKVRLHGFEFNVDSDDKTFRHVTDAEIFDASLVVNGQFPQARLLEVFCEGCDHKAVQEGAATVVDIYRVMGRIPPPAMVSLASKDEHTPPDASETVTISKRRLGALYAHIDRLQEEQRLREIEEVEV